MVILLKLDRKYIVGKPRIDHTQKDVANRQLRSPGRFCLKGSHALSSHQTQMVTSNKYMPSDFIVWYIKSTIASHRME